MNRIKVISTDLRLNQQIKSLINRSEIASKDQKLNEQKVPRGPSKENNFPVKGPYN